MKLKWKPRLHIYIAINTDKIIVWEIHMLGLNDEKKSGSNSTSCRTRLPRGAKYLIGPISPPKTAVHYIAGWVGWECIWRILHRELSPHLGVGKNAQLTRPHDLGPSRGNTASTLSIWLEYRKDITLGRLSGANGVDTVQAVESWHQVCWRLHTTTADYHMYSILLIKSMMVDFQEMHQHTCVCVCLCSCVSLSFPGG